MTDFWCERTGGEDVAMPAPYPQEFRDDVVEGARGREPGVTPKQIAEDFGISEASLTNWLKAVDVEEGKRALHN